MPENSNAGRDKLKASALLLALAGCVALVAWMQMPPPALPDTAPPEAFSAARAFVHIKATAQAPHPNGTPENRAVRDYLLKTLEEMGVPAEVHHCVRDWGRHGTYGGVGRAENVLARIPGTGSGKAFALMAHFDSVPYGPGAADDMSGVATMLEVARALKAGPPLQNDVIFVFTNGEEGGLHGAKAFREHPWAQEIGVLLNMEARGTRGPSYMFETSAENGWLIAQLAAAGVPARATSLMFDVYRPLPFSTDFDPLKKTISGLNIAYVDNFVYYHTPNDSPERLSLKSLQHHGEYALGLARHFGNTPLTDTRAPDAAYFDLLGRKLVHYPLSWNTGLTVLALGSLFLAVLVGFARKRLTAKGLIPGVLAFLLAALAACLVSAALLGIAWVARGGYPRILYDQNLYGAAMALAAIAVFVFIECIAFGRVTWENRLTGGLFWWGALCVVLIVYYPGGAYFAQWSLFFAAAGCVVAFFIAPKTESGVATAALLAAIFGLPGLVLQVQSLFGFFSTLTLLFSPALIFLLAFLLVLVLPVWDFAVRATHGRWLAALAALSLLLFGAAIAISGPSRDRPEWVCMSYALDLDTSTACWLSSDPEPHEWNSVCFPEPRTRATIQEYTPWDKAEYMKAPAAVAALPGPEAELLRDEQENGARVITLFVRSPRQAPAVTLSTENTILSGKIMGIDVEGKEGGWWRTIHILPPEGAEVVLRLPSSSPLRLKLVERSYGLPPVEGLPPRPDSVVGEPNTTLDHHRQLRGNHVLIARTFEFPPAATGAAGR